MDRAALLTVMNDFHNTPAERLAAARNFMAANPQPELKVACPVDLHSHSFYSDGYNSPTMRVYEAWNKQMYGLAISDHDVVDGQLEAIEAGRIFGIAVMPAVEFYSDRNGIEILGFFPDIEDFSARFNRGEFTQVVETIRQAKQTQLRQIMARIPKCFAQYGLNLEIVPSDIDSYLRNGITSKGEVSVMMTMKYGNLLREMGLSKDVKDFQARYTANYDQLNVPLELDLDISPAALIRYILGWGGIPGLAHPTELRTREKLDNAAIYRELENLAADGLQFIEVDGWRNGICPEAGIHQTDLFEAMRERWNREHPDRLPLLATNGGDSHNQPNEGVELGQGRNNNLKPCYAKVEIFAELRARYKSLK